MLRLFLPLVIVSILSAEMVERTQVMMGTFVTLSLPKDHVKEMQQSFKLLKEVEKSLSSYDKHADIYKLNQYHKTSITPYTYHALTLSKQYYQESHGYFNIAIGAITKKLYHFGENERIVVKGLLTDANVDFNGLHFDNKNAWLDKGITIDLGGMGKGFGVDRVAEYLSEQNITEGTIALSGDIRCLSRCTMAIQDPFDEDKTIFTFKTRYPNTSISTSGNYRRFVKEKKNNHLINPKRKASQQVFASVTLISHGDNVDIDAYATAASVMPLKDAILFLDRLDVGYFLVTTDNKQHQSKKFKDFVE